MAPLLGCGPVEYISQVGNRAASAVSSAKLAQADRYAPYEYTAAEEYLHKAREEGGLRRVPGRHRVRTQGRGPREPRARDRRRASRPRRPSKSSRVTPATEREEPAGAAETVRTRMNADWLNGTAGRPCRGASGCWPCRRRAAVAVAGRGLRGHAAEVERARGARDRQGGARSRRLQVRAARAGAGRDARRVRRSTSWIRATTSAPASTCASPTATPARRTTCALRCAPKTPGDRDHDGILDNVDKCPDDPEDKDGFEDEDGCPDKDNDKDGILDTKDKCPNEPEDKDKFEDEDGCPDPDNDTDGIQDDDDKCPNEPEDKDGFEDEDGCPDPDNDKDGVPDAADKCPNDPGPPDNDGCPKKYTHIVVTQEKIELKQKIFFDTDKATIQPRSFSLLDEIGSRVEIAADHDGPHRRPHRLARDPEAQYDPVRGPCGVRAATSSGAGDRIRRGWKRRVTVPTSPSRRTRRLRGGKRIGAWNSSSPSNDEADSKDDPFPARTESSCRNRLWR